MRNRDPRSASRGWTLALAALVVAVFSEGRAWAYLDPGSISLFFQALIAGVLGGLLVIKRYWAQITDGIRRRFSSKPGNDGD